MSPSNSFIDHDVYKSLFFTSSDHLKLHVRHYGAVGSPKDQPQLPIVCLHGLARNSHDFHPLARRLSDDGRDVFVPDYRGRGRSDFAQDWQTYTLKNELDDLLLILEALKISRAIFIGTSRGGLLTMLLSSLYPQMIAGAVLNDIGPVMEIKGLERICSYVGKLPTPNSQEEAVYCVKKVFSQYFPSFSDKDWQFYARGTWHEVVQEAVQEAAQEETHQNTSEWQLSYDPNVMKPFESLDLEKLAEPIWPIFETLKTIPTFIIRGEMSDLLSEQTVAHMCEMHPNAISYTVKGQGHAPLLRDEITCEMIKRFCRAI